MSEATEKQVETKAQTVKRERSPSFPYIGLGKAVERARELHDSARRYEVLVADAAKAWSMAPKSSSTAMTVGALLAFGLIEDVSGTGDTRKIKVSDAGARIIGDTRPGVRDDLLAEAALKPKLIAEYHTRWGADRPAEHFALSELKFEKGFNDEGAARFVRVYDETIRFARSRASDKKGDSGSPAEEPKRERERQLGGAKVGDLVQWTSGGVDQFGAPLRVEQVSDEGDWLWVEGSATGIPMDQVEVVERGAQAPSGALTPPPRPVQPGVPAQAGEREVLRGPLSREVSYRLMVSGDLGPKELGKLIKLLQAQRAILADDEDDEML